MEGMSRDVANFLLTSYFYALYTHRNKIRIRFDSEHAQIGTQGYALFRFVSIEGNSLN